jgi:hypothetical protein
LIWKDKACRLQSRYEASLKLKATCLGIPNEMKFPMTQGSLSSFVELGDVVAHPRHREHNSVTLQSQCPGFNLKKNTSPPGRRHVNSRNSSVLSCSFQCNVLPSVTSVGIVCSPWTVPTVTVSQTASGAMHTSKNNMDVSSGFSLDILTGGFSRI